MNPANPALRFPPRGLRPGLAALGALAASLHAGASETGGGALLPMPLDRHADPAGAGLRDVLFHRAGFDPFNVVALAIFACAILHTFSPRKSGIGRTS